MSGVKIWEENVVIPYGIGQQIKTYVFESRVYQEAPAGYPYPTIEKIYDEKEDKAMPSGWKMSI